jgi:hypothetical protein
VSASITRFRLLVGSSFGTRHELHSICNTASLPMCF